MAEGGDVGFCQSSRAHDRGCEYFAEGGEVDPENLSPADLQAAMVDAANPGEVVPEADLPGSDVVPASDLPEEYADSDVVPDDDLPDNPGLSKYETTGQQIATAVEGAAQGLAGPLATLAETELLGIPAEDIAGRKEANPWTSGLSQAAATVGSMAMGVGVAGAAMKTAEAAAATMRLGKVGSAAVKGMISNGLIEAGNETSKAILGQGDPEEAVSPYLAIGAASLFGGALGAAGAKIAGDVTSKLQGLSDLKMAAKAEEMLAGIGKAIEGGELEKGATQAFAKGYQFWKDIPSRMAKGTTFLGGIHGGGEVDDFFRSYLASKVLEPIASKALNKAGQLGGPTVLRWLSEGGRGSLFKMLEYADKVNKGTSLINNSVDALFKAGSIKAADSLDQSDIEGLRSYIDNGGVDQDIQHELQSQEDDKVLAGFAEGGDVKTEKKRKSRVHDPDDHIANTLPEQNMLVQTAKGRVSGYLSSMRPQKFAPKLAFDNEPSDKEAQKNYTKALQVAANPLGVMKHINNGTIDPDHIKHLTSMYPELTRHLQRKVTDQIVKAQMSGKKPRYVVRQGLSMLMGTALSSELTPQNIQAAQSAFRRPEAEPQQQQGGAPKSKTQALSKSDRSYLTDDQARLMRQQKV